MSAADEVVAAEALRAARIRASRDAHPSNGVFPYPPATHVIRQMSEEQFIMDQVVPEKRTITDEFDWAGGGGEKGQQSRSRDLEKWWEDEARQEIMRTIPKAVEYSSTDLVDIGRSVLGPGHDDARYAEAGVAFYACGKMARIMGAIREGRAPSDDSWFDLGVYARMATRIRQSGSWPGV